MANEFREKTAKVNVARGAGIEVFISTIRQILQRPRVSRIIIDSKGTIEFTYASREDESALPLPDIDYETLAPMAVVRSSDLVQVDLGDNPNAWFAIATLFARAAADIYYPVCLIVSTGSYFWQWHKETAGVAFDPTKEEAYGYPVLSDPQVPPHALVLATAYTPNGTLLDVRRCYMVSMPVPVEISPEPLAESNKEEGIG